MRTLIGFQWTRDQWFPQVVSSNDLSSKHWLRRIGQRALPLLPRHQRSAERNLILIIEYVLNMHSPMVQEDEKSFHDEEADRLLPEPARSFLGHYGCRERRYNHHIVWSSIFFFGPAFLNVMFALLLLRVWFEHYERQKSLYGQCLLLCMPKPLIEAVGLQLDTVDTISRLGPYGSKDKNEMERAILWKNLDGSSVQVAGGCHTSYRCHLFLLSGRKGYYWHSFCGRVAFASLSLAPLRAEVIGRKVVLTFLPALAKEIDSGALTTNQSVSFI